MPVLHPDFPDAIHEGLRKSFIHSNFTFFDAQHEIFMVISQVDDSRTNDSNYSLVVIYKYSHFERCQDLLEETHSDQ